MMDGFFGPAAHAHPVLSSKKKCKLNLGDLMFEDPIQTVINAFNKAGLAGQLCNERALP